MPSLLPIVIVLAIITAVVSIFIHSILYICLIVFGISLMPWLLNVVFDKIKNKKY